MNYRCPHCDKISTQKQWYDTTEDYCGNVTIKIKEAKDDTGHVCPHCTVYINSKELIKIDPLESKRIELKTLKKVAKQLNNLDKETMLLILNDQILGLIKEINKVEPHVIEIKIGDPF